MIKLTNGAQVADTAIIAHVTAEIDGGYVRDRVTVTQYDDKMPVVAVSLMYQNQPYVPPDGASLNVRMRKTDGHGVYNPCIGADTDGVVYLVITQQMTAVHGNSTFTVEVSVDGGVKNTPPIGIAINPNPVQEGQIESADEFLTLQEILAQCQKYGQIVEANAANIQTVVDEMDAIKDAPAAAERAEAAAAEAEKFAAESKGFRTFHGAVVPGANGNLDPSRSMTVGPAASVEIESAGDRIQSVTALGFTQQAGSGDPSPTNIRQLTNGGLKLVAKTFDGSEDEGWFSTSTSSDGKVRWYNASGSLANIDLSSNDAQFPGYSSWLPPKSLNQTFAVQEGVSATYSTGALVVYIEKFSSSGDSRSFKAYLADNPLTVWYATTDGTGFLYAPIILQGGEYRATCLELTAPLCDGDSVVSWAKSGCDKSVLITNSTVFRRIGVQNGKYRFEFSEITDIEKVPNSTTLGTVFSEKYNRITGAQAYAEETGICVTTGGYISIYDPELQTDDAIRDYFEANPLLIWYRSTNYTPADDIPVSLETHVQAVLVLDGTENVQKLTSDAGQFFINNAISQPAKGGVDSGACSVAKRIYDKSGNGFYFNANSAQLIFGAQYASQFESADAFKTKLSELYAAGTPAQFVYPLATPITYAHPAVVLEAATGGQLTYTVTGQSGGTVSVALKPFQDGGHAATADNAQQLDGLTLAALQNLLVPVGFIFSWAPVDDGPDLSTPAKVAEYFGFGTWAAYGAGQVLVGVDSGQTEFATVGKTGGEKAHSLTTAEGPKHAHGVKWEHEGGLGTGNGVLIKDANDGESYPYTYFTEFSGSGQAHNNLQPYITVYRWQRVA